MKKFLIRPLLLLAFSLLLTISCKKKADDIPDINFNPSITYGSMADQDGNVYKTVTIGTQVWMAENLKTTIYRNGDPIVNVTDNTQWKSLANGAYCIYNNDDNNKRIYGCLYNWYAVNDIRNLAPIGWHVPSNADWITLYSFLGGEDVAGFKLKENGTSHWIDPNTDATNESGFTALPGGFRGNISFFGMSMGYGYAYLNRDGIWWSTSTDSTSVYAGYRLLDHYISKGDKGYISKNCGYSIRCVKN
jgi:uncharacterized protein (TIGR02145 family)